LKKYPAKANRYSTVEVERNLKWDNFKADFLAILNRDQVGRENTEGRKHIRNNVVPSSAPVCC
jgi:hypothetical protein